MALKSWQLSIDEATNLFRSELGMRPRNKTWHPGGKFETVIANFSEHDATDSTGFNLFGVDGINPAFVYDGEAVHFIETGMASSGFEDNPCALAVLPAESLVLGYSQGTLLMSSLGQPTEFNVSAGAAEIAVADEVVHLATQPNDYLAIFCKSSVRLLIGKTVLDMEMTTYSERLSVTRWSLQKMGDPVFLTDSGISRLSRVQDFGDFRDHSLTLKVKPLLDKLDRKILCSWNVSSRNEYRIMFQNGLGAIVKFLVGDEGEATGVSTFDYGFKFNTVFSGEDYDGTEHIYAGDMEGGYVYRLEHGTSFDGRPIEALVTTVFNFMGSAERRKRFKKVQVEISTSESAELLSRISLDYDSPEAPAAFPHELVTNGGDGYYDLNYFEAVMWADDFNGLAEHYIQGVGRNVSVSLYSKTDKEPPHVLDSAIFHWAPRGRRR